MTFSIYSCSELKLKHAVSTYFRAEAIENSTVVVKNTAARPHPTNRIVLEPERLVFIILSVHGIIFRWCKMRKPFEN